MKKLLFIFFIAIAVSSLFCMEHNRPMLTIFKKLRISFSLTTSRTSALAKRTPPSVHELALLNEDKLILAGLEALLNSTEDPSRPTQVLHAAINAGNTSLVSHIIKNKFADPNEILDGKQALHKAMEVDNLPIELLRILLVHGSSLTQKDNEYCLPITRAIKNMYDPRIIQILLEHNSPTETRSIMDAVLKIDDDDEGHLKIIRLLCKKMPQSIDTIVGKYYTNTPLTVAIESGKINTVELLLQEGANPNSSNSFAHPIFYALCNGKALEMIRLLCRYGADTQTRAHKTVPSFFTLKEPFAFELSLDKDMTPLDFVKKLYKSIDSKLRDIKHHKKIVKRYKKICKLLSFRPVDI